MRIVVQLSPELRVSSQLALRFLGKALTRRYRAYAVEYLMTTTPQSIHFNVSVATFQTVIPGKGNSFYVYQSILQTLPDRYKMIKVCLDLSSSLNS